MGTKATLEERDRRFQRIRKEMDKENLDVLLISGKGHGWTGRGYWRYMTDFHIWGHDGMILFPREGEPLLTFTSGGVASMIAQRGWITEAYGDWDVSPTIVEKMKERGLDKARVGLAGQKMILPVGVYDILREGLPHAEFVKADNLMDRVRAVKSDLEITQMRELWEMATDAMNLFVDGLEPGKTERELSAPPVKLIHERGSRGYLIFFNGNIPGDRVVDLNGIVKYHMEICNESGHWMEITVQPAYSAPSEDELRLMKTELLAYEEVRKVARPGATIQDLADTFDRVLKQEGFELKPENKDLHHYDWHGQGMDWIEWPRWSPNDPERNDTVLEAGMYLNHHPFRLTVPDVGRTGINDGMLITEEGGKRIYPEWDMNYRIMG